jgi:hypothetical protein
MYCAPVAEDPTYCQVNTENSAPTYSWYQPEMTRADCDSYLMRQGEGAFVVRDSTATPGWYILAVKTRNTVVHDQIKHTEEGKFQLLPSTTSAVQPTFDSMPDLVEYYGTHRTEGSMPYQLAFNNPLYDNQLLKTVRSTPVTFSQEAAAPLVPSHERPVEV